MRACWHAPIWYVLIVAEFDSLAMNKSAITVTSPYKQKLEILLPISNISGFSYNVIVFLANAEEQQSVHRIGQSLEGVGSKGIVFVKDLLPDTQYRIAVQRCYKSVLSVHKKICGDVTTFLWKPNRTKVDTSGIRIDTGETKFSFGEAESVYAYSVGW